MSESKPDTPEGEPAQKDDFLSQFNHSDVKPAKRITEIKVAKTVSGDFLESISGSGAGAGDGDTDTPPPSSKDEVAVVDGKLKISLGSDIEVGESALSLPPPMGSAFNSASSLANKSREAAMVSHVLDLAGMAVQPGRIGRICRATVLFWSHEGRILARGALRSVALVG